MQLFSIYDKPPIRLLRQVGSISDARFAEFLASQRAFKLRQALRGDRWVDVFDIRSFDGLSPTQLETAQTFLRHNLPCMAESTLGVAFVIPPHLDVGIRHIAERGERFGIPSHINTSLDEALYWALELAYEEDAALDPELVLGGIDAFRFTIR